MKLFIYFGLYFLLQSALQAYVDSDMDGVDDSVDKCPNTPLTEIVAEDGCSIESLVSYDHYDIIVGVDVSNSDYRLLSQSNTISTPLQLDYYYKNFSLSLSAASYRTTTQTTSENGFYDTYVSGAYSFYINKALLLRVGGGVVLPTYTTTLNNNKTDYFTSLHLSYSLKKWRIFGSLNYTMINDTNYYDANTSIEYQNTQGYSTGVGYNFTSEFYGSVSYAATKSIYVDVEDIQRVSLYIYKTLDEHWFVTGGYSYGLSESASKHYASLRVGYYF